jgi:hypothetical protein
LFIICLINWALLVIAMAIPDMFYGGTFKNNPFKYKTALKTYDIEPGCKIEGNVFISDDDECNKLEATRAFMVMQALATSAALLAYGAAGFMGKVSLVEPAAFLNFGAFATGLIALAIAVDNWEDSTSSIPDASYEIGFFLWVITLVLHLVLGFISKGGASGVGQTAAVPATIN